MDKNNNLKSRFVVRYGLAVGAVALGFLLRLGITSFVGPSLATFITFYPAVMIVALLVGFGPGLLATFLSAVLVAGWVHPAQGYKITDPLGAVEQTLFLGMGVLMSIVARLYRRARQKARESEQQVRFFASQVLSAQENERRRIATEVHDVLGSSLSAIKFKVEDALGRLPEEGNSKELISQPLLTLIPLIKDTIEEARRIQADLRPPLLDDLGLVATFSWFCRRFKTIYSGIEVEQAITVQEEEIPDHLKIVFFRIAQEALNNIAKHGKAESVYLGLHKADGHFELCIKDNGEGFDPEGLSSREVSKRGLGLTSMKERAELSGGSFSIDSGKGKGTVIRAVWPL